MVSETDFLADALSHGREIVRQSGHADQLAENNEVWSSFCQTLLTPMKIEVPSLKNYAERLTEIERIYSASLVYAMAQPVSQRKRLAMYFTPPSLSNYVLDCVEKFGADFRNGQFVDPAAGGASFIGPIANRMCARGASTDKIAASLLGIEIDPALAEFARAAATSVIGRSATEVVVTGDGLELGETGRFDGVIGNPPYGVLSPVQRGSMPSWAMDAFSGYANLYGLFLLRGLQLLRDGGLLAFLVPTSFITGPYFKSLREYLATHSKILEIDTIAQRQDMFRDVSQDVCLFICRKERPSKNFYLAKARNVGRDLKWRRSDSYLIESTSDLPWYTTSLMEKSGTTCTLEDLGYQVRCGPIVYNRDEGLFENTRRKRRYAVPLVWGHVIKVGQSVEPASRNRRPGHRLVTYVSSNRSTPPVVCPAIVIQRTNSSDQLRRIRAGFVDQEWIDRFGGFYGENHVVVISPIPEVDQLVDLKLLWRVLSSATVDKRLRPLLSSNSVNITALRGLPLPNNKCLRRRDILETNDATFEDLLEEAYK